MRPKFMRNGVSYLLRQARELAENADASTLGPEEIGVLTEEIARLRDEAAALREARFRIQADSERAASRRRRLVYVRALRRTLLELGVPSDVADRLIDTGADFRRDEGGGNFRGPPGMIPFF